MIGWGLKQKDNYRKIAYHHSIQMLYPNFPIPGIKPKYLKELSDILSLSQDLLHKLYAYLMSNTYRYVLLDKKIW